MKEGQRLHEVLFDELERQRVFAVDVGRLTAAVLKALEITGRASEVRRPYQRCVNGACE